MLKIDNANAAVAVATTAMTTSSVRSTDRPPQQLVSVIFFTPRAVVSTVEGT